MTTVETLLVAVVAVTSWVATLLAVEPVSVERLDRFAQRQQLRITAANAGAVVRYLAITRRWRVAGTAVAICFSMGAGLRHGMIMADIFAAFVGWFVGAIIAEWRVGSRYRAEPRRARLTRRRRGTYVGTWPQAVLWSVSAVALGVGALDLRHGSSGTLLPSLVNLAMALLTLDVVIVVGRHLVLRPQDGAAGEDVRAADDALRSRSLRVLSGSAIALMTIVLAGLIRLSTLADQAVLLGAALAVAVLGVVAGWWVALAPARAAPTPAPAGATP